MPEPMKPLAQSSAPTHWFTREGLSTLAIRGTSGLAFIIVSAVVGQYCVVIGQQLGWFSNPLGKLTRTAFLLNRVVDSSWFGWLGGLTLGVAVGLWVARLLSPHHSNRPSAAILVEGPLEPEKQLVSVKLHYPSASGAQECHVILGAARHLSNLSVRGRFALITHYISHAEWMWTFPNRLKESSSLIAGEVISIPLFQRAKLSENPQDNIRVLGQSIPKRSGTDWAQGEIVFVEIVITSAEGSKTLRWLYNFRRADGRQFIDALDCASMSYVEDRGAYLSC